MKVKYNGKPFSRRDVGGTAFNGKFAVFGEGVQTGKVFEADLIPENLKDYFDEVKSSKKTKKGNK